ncbi:hypothetical protein GPECTOR_33g651 [Gonium pectorale]|uniref:Uncharacterized protein n=1 Tax=Gonium pectorale TaxID=33097 RepID=A0A150GD58_GONPE|nr:hypothetical protein GPECTOR_33g651 [Gonium pectorale]|eukprot:KXZ47769.1 hypothetical protein GPECTOR_33g651 [Gonium pectorale]
MDETRAKRITDHFRYMKERKQYRLALHDLFGKWRGEITAQQAKEADAQKRQRAERDKEHAELMELRREKAAASLQEQIKKAELDQKLAQLQLQRAMRLEAQLKRREKRRADRQQQLLEASRRWIRHDELEAAINRAMDNPEPFGFITSLPVRQGV